MDDKCVVCQNRPLCKKAKSTCYNDENFVINWHYVTYLNEGFYPWVDKNKVNEFIFKVRNEEARKRDYEKHVLGKEAIRSATDNENSEV